MRYIPLLASKDRTILDDYDGMDTAERCQSPYDVHWAIRWHRGGERLFLPLSTGCPEMPQESNMGYHVRASSTRNGARPVDMHGDEAVCTGVCRDCA